jgi:hypothetical protein
VLVPLAAAVERADLRAAADTAVGPAHDARAGARRRQDEVAEIDVLVRDADFAVDHERIRPSHGEAPGPRGDVAADERAVFAALAAARAGGARQIDEPEDQLRESDGLGIVRDKAAADGGAVAQAHDQTPCAEFLFGHVALEDGEALRVDAQRVARADARVPRRGRALAAKLLGFVHVGHFVAEAHPGLRRIGQFLAAGSAHLDGERARRRQSHFDRIALGGRAGDDFDLDRRPGGPVRPVLDAEVARRPRSLAEGGDHEIPADFVPGFAEGDLGDRAAVRVLDPQRHERLPDGRRRREPDDDARDVCVAFDVERGAADEFRARPAWTPRVRTHFARVHLDLGAKHAGLLGAPAVHIRVRRGRSVGKERLALHHAASVEFDDFVGRMARDQDILLQEAGRDDVQAPRTGVQSADLETAQFVRRQMSVVLAEQPDLRAGDGPPVAVADDAGDTGEMRARAEDHHRCGRDRRRRRGDLDHGRPGFLPSRPRRLEACPAAAGGRQAGARRRQRESNRQERHTTHVGRLLVAVAMIGRGRNTPASPRGYALGRSR